MASIAELARGEKSRTQSITQSLLTQLIWHPKNRSFRFGTSCFIELQSQHNKSRFVLSHYSNRTLLITPQFWQVQFCETKKKFTDW